MILILSTRHDVNTNGIIEWLRYFQVSFFRLNDEDILNGEAELNFNLLEGFFTIKYRGRIITSYGIKVVWFRKFGFLNSYEDFFRVHDKTSNLQRYVYAEFDKIRRLLFKLLENKKWLYNKNKMPSKIEVLMVAKKNGLKIPKTIVSNNKSYLKENYIENEELITKSLGEATKINFLGYATPLLTQKIKLNEFKQKRFFPSLFQSYVNKLFELRIFYLDGSFYSMAMFTQSNSKTSIDFRNYDFKNSPRRVPYLLPKEIQNKIDYFMKELGVNTGSIDMIYTKEKEYIFLEVNPSGQFGMTSVPCNYPINREMAKFLKKSVNN